MNVVVSKHAVIRARQRLPCLGSGAAGYLRRCVVRAFQHGTLTQHPPGWVSKRHGSDPSVQWVTGAVDGKLWCCCVLADVDRPVAIVKTVMVPPVDPWNLLGA